MKQSKGRIPYRLLIALYLMFAIWGFLVPLGMSITFSNKDDYGAVIAAICIGFSPNLILAIILVAITAFLKLRHSSPRRRKIALAGSFFSTLVVIWSIYSLLHYTLLRWQGTYPITGSMDGTPEWLAAGLGGCSSGLLILFLGYLALSRHLLSPPHSE